MTRSSPVERRERSSTLCRAISRAFQICTTIRTNAFVRGRDDRGDYEGARKFISEINFRCRVTRIEGAFREISGRSADRPRREGGGTGEAGMMESANRASDISESAIRH